MCVSEHEQLTVKNVQCDWSGMLLYAFINERVIIFSLIPHEAARQLGGFINSLRVIELHVWFVTYSLIFHLVDEVHKLPHAVSLSASLAPTVCSIAQLSSK